MKSIKGERELTNAKSKSMFLPVPEPKSVDWERTESIGFHI